MKEIDKIELEFNIIVALLNKTTIWVTDEFKLYVEPDNRIELILNDVYVTNILTDLFMFDVNQTNKNSYVMEIKNNFKNFNNANLIQSNDLYSRLSGYSCDSRLKLLIMFLNYCNESYTKSFMQKISSDVRTQIVEFLSA